MKPSSMWIALLFSIAVAVPAGAREEDEEALLPMTNGAVIEVRNLAKGGTVRLLTNPDIAILDSQTIPLPPSSPIWAPVPNGSYGTSSGTTFVIRDSKITQVLDRNGANVTDSR